MMNSPRLSARFSRDRDGNLLCLSERAKNASSATNDAADDPRQLQQASFYFVLVGIGYLFPFSALTQPVDYWNMLFPDFNIEFPLTCIYMYTNLIMLALLVFCGADESPSFTPRIVGGFVGQLLVLVFVPTSYFFYLSESYTEVAVLGATAVAAIVTAFIDSSVIALSSQYPLRVQEYFQLGVGISTLIGSIYRDVTKAVFPADMLVESSLLYFYSGAVTIGVCIAAYYKLLQLPLSKTCLAAAVEEAKRHSDATITPLDAQAVGESFPLLAAPIASPPPVSKWIILRKIF